MSGYDDESGDENQVNEDLIAIVEAAYRVEQDEGAWLAGIRRAALPLLDRGLGGSAFLYDASDIRHLRVWSFLGDDNADGNVVRAIEASGPERARWIFRSQACRTASEGPEFKTPTAHAFFRSLGFEDLLFVNGADATGRGCFLTARLPKRSKVSHEDNETWSRVAAHLASGFRLRARLDRAGTHRSSFDHAEVVLSPRGKIQHLAAELAYEDLSERAATSALRDAAVAVDAARTRKGGRSTSALATWKSMTAARWTLVDHFDTDGRRYLVACANSTTIPEPSSLSDRERQAMSYAALGHSNKLIAYELGVSTSTIGVLLHRAMRKLGVGTRKDAIAIFVEHQSKK